MLSVFPPNARTFIGTGLAVLDADLISAVVEEAINGEFTLSLSYPADAPHAHLLSVGHILACPTPGRKAAQGFRIARTTHTLEGAIEVEALHISYDLASNLIADAFVVNKNAHQALTHILGAAATPHSFTSTSNVNTVASARMVRVPVLEAIFGSEDNSFISRWGGEVLRDNHHLTHVERLGADRGVVIRDQKNLTGFTSTRDATSVITRMLPVGFDGLTLPELYVDSPHLADYPSPLVGLGRFEHIKAIKDEKKPGEGELSREEAFAALRNAARESFAKGVDVPAVSWEVSFVDLATTNEYAAYAPLERVELGDTVHVTHSGYGAWLRARVSAYSYNPMTRAYITIRLGTINQSLTATTRTLHGALKQAMAVAVGAGVDAHAALVSANGKNTIHHSSSQPSVARVGDTWFKPNGSATEIWVYTATPNGDEWVSLASDINHSHVDAELAAAKRDVAQAGKDAREALASAQRVNEALDAQAQELADAQAEVENAVQHAIAAESEARAASSSLQRVVGEAGAARRLALDAKKNADAVTTTATNLRADVTAQAGEVVKAKEAAERASSAQDALRLEFLGLKDATTKAVVSLGESVSLKASKDELISLINVSPETVLISGNRIHITGRTTIDDASIHGAKIVDATIASAKIASLDAAKITTGTLNAARIGAGSITSDKLTIANGFITNAMVHDATITSAKVASLDAGKITSGFIAAERIAAKSITSDKLTIHDGFIMRAMIRDGAINNAKITSLSAEKITTGYLAAERIKAGSITSDKLTIANGYIKSAMIADAAVSNAKIASLDAGKITSGYVNAARIQAGSITADKLASNAIQIGLAGWKNAIRISPYTISWYSGSTLEGRIGSSGMEFYYGSRFIGVMGQGFKEGDNNVRGIAMQLNGQGDYVTWSYRSGTSGTYTTMLTLDPKGRFNPGQAGIHLGSALYTNAYNFYTNANRGIYLADCTLTGLGTYPGWASLNGKAKLIFQTEDLMFVTRNYFYNMTYLVSRVKDLMTRMNTLISLLNHGWITSITDKGGGNISWNFYSNTGLQSMSTALA